MNYQNNEIFRKLSLRQKISIAVSLVTAIILLFFFAFTIFFIALGMGAVIFISRLAFGRRNTQQTHSAPPNTPRIYRHDPSKDDDVIDV